MTIHRTNSYDSVINPISRKNQQLYDWIYSDQDISVLQDKWMKMIPRICSTCKRYLQDDAPIYVKHCNVACRQIGKK